MSTVKIIGETLPNIPWQEKPADAAGPVWRHSGNPVIDRNPAKGIARIFNSAVVPYEGRFVGVFRAETINGRPHLHLGWSEDGYGWKIDEERIPFTDEDGKPFQPRYAYDPRLVKVGDTYYIIWCTDFYGASIGVAKTRDFQSFVRLENPFLPFNRNGELFPKKIGGNFIMLSRPSDSGHTPFGDVYYRNVFLDLVQTVRILMSMEQVDPDRIGVHGCSQGGALTVACAALEPRVKLAIPVYPFLTDYKKAWEMDVTSSAYEELAYYFRFMDPLHETQEAFFNKLGYIDVQNLADRIRAKVIFVTGLADSICPPYTQFAAYNKIVSANGVGRLS